MNEVAFDFSFIKNNYFSDEAFKTLRTNFLFCDPEIKTVLLTSSNISEGKTTISVGLAFSLAEMGKKVLLLDTDLRNSSIARRFASGHGSMGLSQYLSGQAKLEEVLFHTSQKGLDIIFAGQFPPNPVELLGSSSMKKLLAAMREEYDYVLLDSAPLGLVVDSAVTAAFCDGAIIVLSAGQTRARTALEVKEQLERSGCHILGTILNCIESEKRFGRKEYSYYYSHNSEAPKPKTLRHRVKGILSKLDGLRKPQADKAPEEKKAAEGSDATEADTKQE